ncbi:cytochrome P450 monooxygenase [Aspergillus campestris IBT 28561]|uniref:Cytochrome P450 monooxygenase n=1 Tax=Aspergillus campestris (strain IBT 28561) TaxID=1392248 RepID=A0A2I1CSU1_ASPC2|nr:cytochrome P450 monooxygenase [Aspergillus campestris IBT 28561]PKY00693.1 cytochrome P450 monooxygenase [Aspergillus campestris IBT 28561]
MSPMITVAITAVGLYLLKWLFQASFKQKATLGKLPPGPPRKPFVGNLNDLPSHEVKPWEHWLKHKDLYGPISSLTVSGQNIVIVNDMHLAIELLERRSLTYSSRPHMNFASLAGWDKMLGCVEYSPRFKAIRRAIHRQVGSNVSVAGFRSVQEVEVRRLLYRLLEDPANLTKHIRKEAGGIVLKIAYGYNVDPHQPDPLVDLADKAMDDFSFAFLSGTWAVDFLPFLKHVPAWFPGAQFARVAKAFRARAHAFSTVPYDFTRSRMAKGDYTPSFLSNLLEEGVPKPGSEEEIVVKWASSVLYGGGADTTVSTMRGWFLAMAMFPEVQRQAQAEIDRVVGPGRLPTFEDRENLPYINAMIKEIIRWHPILPMGAAHTSIRDDVWGEYVIPKGTMVMPNTWAFTHDPVTYPDPEAFKPERFLHSEGHVPEQDPYYLTFGHGRRVCPGRTLADANLFLSIAQVVASFNITKPIRDGKEVDLSLELTNGIIVHPKPFEVDIKPRSAAYAKIIQEGDLQWEDSNADELSGLQ